MDKFSFLNDGNYEVRQIRSFAADYKRAAERKEYNMIFHVLYSLLCSLCIYVAIDGAAIGFGTYAKTLCLMLSGPLCVFTFLYSPLILKLSSVALPLSVTAVRLFAQNSLNLYSIAGAAFTYLLCLSVGVVLTMAVIRGYSKNTCLVAVTVCFAAIFLCQIFFVQLSLQGSLSPSLLSENIDAVFEAVIKNSVESLDKTLSLEQLKVMAGISENVTKDEALLKLSDMFSQTLSMIKPFLPSVFIISCMLYGFVVIALFSVLVRIFKLDVFVCIMDDFWTYRPSLVTVRLYDILFFVFIITMFVNIPENISAAIINLFAVMTPLMCVLGINSIYSFLLKRNLTKPAAIAATAAIMLVIFLIFSGSVLFFFMLGSLGTAFYSAKERAEKQVVPIKLLEEKALFEQVQKTQNIQK